MGVLFYLLIGALSFLYASVGHGGGSGYLAAMSLYGITDPNQMRSMALFLNVFVSFIAFLGFASKKHFNRKLFIYLALGSIPMAFVGGSIDIRPFWYYLLVALFLGYSSLRLIGLLGKWKDETVEANKVKVIVSGGAIGLIAGIIGIGGGILLSPLLLIMRWANAKTTAGIAALFIFLNSISGLLGLYFSGKLSILPDAHYWVLSVVLFGASGAWIGSSILSQKAVRLMLVVVLSLAAIKLIITL